MITKMKSELISLEIAYELSYAVALKILASNFRPDIIVAVARGGFAPGRFLCDFLQVHDMASIQVKHYAAGANKNEKAWVLHPLNADVKGKKVLLADDVNDTGDTLRVAHPHILALNPAEVKIAVLHEKKTTSHPADFYGEYLMEWRWIIYPWAMIEDVSAFLQRMEPAPKNHDEAISRLHEDYGLVISKEKMEMVFSVMEKSRLIF